MKKASPRKMSYAQQCSASREVSVSGVSSEAGVKRQSSIPVFSTIKQQQKNSSLILKNTPISEKRNFFDPFF